jgi:hypothetical protein
VSGGTRKRRGTPTRVCHRRVALRVAAIIQLAQLRALRVRRRKREGGGCGRRYGRGPTVDGGGGRQRVHRPVVHLSARSTQAARPIRGRCWGVKEACVFNLCKRCAYFEPVDTDVSRAECNSAAAVETGEAPHWQATASACQWHQRPRRARGKRAVRPLATCTWPDWRMVPTAAHPAGTRRQRRPPASPAHSLDFQSWRGLRASLV